MVPKFNSMTDMIGFLRALPANANYQAMLEKDFGYNVPADALAWQKEYFFKYLVQGQYRGLSGVELEKYAIDGTLKIKDRYYVDLKEAPVAVAVQGAKFAHTGRGRPQKYTGADGEVKFLEHRNQWVVFRSGKVAVVRNNKEAAVRFYAKKFGV